MKKKICKIIGFSMFSLCVMTAAVFAAVRTEASGSNQIQYLERTYTADNTAPADIPDGYLFAGWYTDADATTVDPVVNPVLQQTYYAKFVPKEVLGIVAQVSKNVLEEETSDKTGNSIRIITSLDSEQYHHIGFRIQKGNAAAYDAETTKKVYETLYAIGATEATEENVLEYTPQENFHAVSKYFKTWTINKIPETAFNTDITVTPYWITLDGTRVNGTTAIKTVNLGRAWIYVDAEDTESAQLGTYNAPYTTIGGAVAFETILNPTVILKDNASDNMTVSETVGITRNVTLTSEGNFTLKRGSGLKAALFTISSGNEFTLNRENADNTLTIDGAKDTVSATSALVHTKGTLNINEGVVLQNNYNSGNGGAVYLESAAKLVMTGGRLRDNTTGGNGGAIHAIATSEITLKNTELSGNTAYQGGAINLPAASSKDKLITLENVTITNNTTTTKSSGAIYVGQYRQLEINGDKTLISGNSSKTTGGAIGTADYAYITMNAGTISENEANTADGGGGIFLWQGTFVMNGGTISENTTTNAAGKGGAISGGGKSTITINGGIIEKNEAVDGGAIYLNYSGSNASSLTVTGGIIRENGANMKTTGLGGGIYMAPKTTFVMTGGTIEDNEAVTSKGEGVYCLGSTFKIGGEANLCDAIYLGNATPITVTDTLANAVGKITRYEYTENAVIAQTADNVEADLADKFALDTVVSTCVVSEGQVTLGAVSSTEVTTYDALNEAITNAMTDVTVNVTADIEMTGAIVVPSGIHVTLIGTGNLTRGTGYTGEFFNIPLGADLTIAGMGQEKALTINGGYDSSDTTTRAAKPLIVNAGTLTMMEDVVLKDNYNTTTATNLGGAILTSGTCNIAGGMIQNTHSANNNGSIYLSGGTLNMTGGTLTQGTMRGVFVNSGKFTLDGGAITGNVQASGSGAGVVVNTNASGTNEFIMNSGTISYNEATTNAGGINLGGVGAVMTMNGGTIRGNIAKGSNGGGAIYMSGNTKLTITDGIIKNNEAKGTAGGGAIFASSSKGILITGGTISGNIANNTAANGGAICLTNVTTLTMTGGILKNNTAGANGGAIHAVANSTIDLSNVELSNNTATGQGGAINLPGGSEAAPGNLMKLTNVTAKDNRATTKSSGVIYVGAYRKLEISGDKTIMSGNISATYGGAIGTGNYASVTMKGGTISENTANGGAGGGILMNSYADFTMNGGVIQSNAVASGYTGENVHINANGSIKLSDAANVESVYCVSANTIKVMAPLTTENAITAITLQTPNVGVTAVSYTGATETDMAALCSKFSLANTQYTLSVSENNLVVSEVTE